MLSIQNQQYILKKIIKRSIQTILVIDIFKKTVTSNNDALKFKTSQHKNRSLSLQMIKKRFDDMMRT